MLIRSRSSTRRPTPPSRRLPSATVRRRGRYAGRPAALCRARRRRGSGDRHRLNTVTADIPIEGGGGGIAITPDGASAFVASGGVTVINTATNTVADFFYLEGGNVHGVALSPDGSRAYFLTNGNDIFGSDAGVVVLDTATCAVIRKIVFGALPGQMALAPDGSRVYVGIQSVWVNTGYGAAFIPGRSVAVIDAITNTWVGSIDLGAGGAALDPAEHRRGHRGRGGSQRRLRRGSPPRRGRGDQHQHECGPAAPAVGPGPNGVAVVPDAAATLVPYVIDAVDDDAPLSVPSSGGTAVANVLANDRIGGAPVTLAHVTLSQQSSTDAHITLDAATGSVDVGRRRRARRPTSLVYQICEIASPLNCDQASVRVTVRDPYVIDAVNDSTTSLAGKNGPRQRARERYARRRPATLATVKVALVSSTSPGITLNTANGSVFAAPGTAVGTHSLAYRICEIADPGNCDAATVTVAIVPLAIDAVNDIGVSTRAGGVAQGNVLANDRFAGAAATLAKVKLTFVSSTGAGVTLQRCQRRGAGGRRHRCRQLFLVYRICEIASPANCDQATVTVTVNPYVVNAVNDSAQGLVEGGGNGAGERARQRLSRERARHDRDGQAVAGVADAIQQSDQARSVGRLGRRARQESIPACTGSCTGSARSRVPATATRRP